MPPARPRALDDSRSETSSTIGLLKERNTYNLVTGSGVSKNKRTANTSHAGSVKANVNGTTQPPARAEQIDLSLPKTDWNTLAPSILHVYRTAYRLPTPSAYTNPHAELIYNSSYAALRAPSAVLARRRLRDLKHHHRKAAAMDTSSSNPAVNGKSKHREKEKDTSLDQSSQSEHLLKPPSPNHPNPSQNLDGTSDASNSITQHLTFPPPNIPPEHIGKQTPVALATAVRKHFNAQQLSEIETMARFAYVVRQTRSREATSVEGSDGDGGGNWMGSHGREVRRGEGGEVGFRLRFRP